MTNAIAKRGRDVPPARTGGRSIAIALGGGGARGLAHILMLEVLDELGLRPSLIAGTSIGAVFGAAFAAGLSAREIRAHAEEALSQRFDLLRQIVGARADPVTRVFNLFAMRTALLKPEALLEVLLPSSVPRSFEDLAIPIEIVATDFYARDVAVLSQGDLRRAMAASIALPVIFQPVRLGGRVLMDGGLVNPLPFDVIAGRADITIAVDVSGEPSGEPTSHGPGALEAILASSQILQRSIVREKLKSASPDILVEVDVDEFYLLEFHRFRDVLKAAEPAKAHLRRQLVRVLAAATVTEAPVLPSPGSSADGDEPRGGRRRRRLSLPIGRKRRAK